MKYFIGTEAEGPNRGMSTFFIRGDATQVPPAEVLEKFEQIYLGAGNIRGADPQILKALGKLEKRHVTIECDSLEQIQAILPYLSLLDKHYTRIVYVIPTPDAAAMDVITDIKFIDDEKLTWNVIGATYTTMLGDKLYEADKEVTF